MPMSLPDNVPPPPEEPAEPPDWPGEPSAAEEPAGEPPTAPSALAIPTAAAVAAPPAGPLADYEAERALLGALLLNDEVFYQVADIVSAHDFAHPAHRRIWEAIQALMQQRQSLDVPLLAAELRRRDALDDIGGLAYLSALLHSADHSLNAEQYARLVADYSLRRQLQTAAQEIVRLVHRTDLDGDQVLEEAEKLLFRIGGQRYRRDVEPLPQVLEDIYAYLKHLKENEGVAGIPTGFRLLDNLLKGLQPSDFIIVAGRPSMGKSAFLTTLALNAARLGQRVAIFSLEMSNEQVAQRMLSIETGIGSQLFRDPRRLTPAQWERLEQAIANLSHLAIYLDDTPALTPLQLRVKCLRLQQQYGLDLVLVDYLQLMRGEHANQNRVQEVSYISRALKILARDLNVPVVAAAQLSRAVESRDDKRPILSDLRESGSLEQDADVVMFLYRENYYKQKELQREGQRVHISNEPEPIEVIVAKHRNGPTGKVELVFDPRWAAFREPTARGPGGPERPAPPRPYAGAGPTPVPPEPDALPDHGLLDDADHILGLTEEP